MRALPAARLASLLAFALALAPLLAAPPAGAHTRSQSTSRWEAEGRRLEGTFSVDARRATLLYGLGEASAAAARSLPERVAAHLAATVRLVQAGERCAARRPRPLPAARGFVRVALAFRCPEPLARAPAELAVGAFFPVSAGHSHLMRLSGPGRAAGAGGLASREAVLTEGAHRVEVGGAGGLGPSAGGLAGFLGLGAEHVLGGLDHLAFLAALLLLCAGVRDALVTVTGFTLGHSATLALAVLGWIDPVRPAVEALIGFSIAFAAAEALAPRARLGRGAALGVGALLLALPLAGSPLPFAVFAGLALFALGLGLARRVGGADGSRAASRASPGWTAPALAVGFGLAHGAGFAGVLLEMEIPRASLAAALLGFNLGVEAGQIAAVALMGLGAAALARVLASRSAMLRELAAASLLALGTYWFVERSLGG